MNVHPSATTGLNRAHAGVAAFLALRSTIEPEVRHPRGGIPRLASLRVSRRVPRLSWRARSRSCSLGNRVGADACGASSGTRLDTGALTRPHTEAQGTPL